MSTQGQTIISITSTGQSYTIPGTHWTVESVRQNYASSIDGLSAMVGTDKMEGGNKIITFSPRTGNKG